MIREPRPADGAHMWTVARDGSELDLNSSYAYPIMARNFSATCRVAVSSNEIVGYVLGYSPPEPPIHLFVWQVAVRDDQRGRGVAAHMIEHLIATGDVDALEGTVEKTNDASRVTAPAVPGLPTARDSADRRRHSGQLWSDCGRRG